MTQVTISHLTKIYGANMAPAVDDLSLDVESGQLTALLGPSGCGKTTTMKMIAGLLRPTAGEIAFDHKSIVSIPPEKRGAVMVFQNYLLFPYMTVGDNIGFGLKMRGVDKQEIKKRVADILELVQLPGVENRRPKELSGGQQQRIALARALIVEPNLLLLDEPLSNLDAHLRDEMRSLIRGIQQELHITTIFVTHDQEEAVVLADSIALMFAGVLQQYDTPETFYERPASVHIARFFGGLNFIPGAYYDGMIRTDIGEFRAPRSAVAAGDAVLSIRPEAIDIADSGGNCIRGRVFSQIYVGKYTRTQVALGNHILEAVNDPAVVKNFHVGDEIGLRFDPEKIWVLPPDDSVSISQSNEGELQSGDRQQFDLQEVEAQVFEEANA